MEYTSMTIESKTMALKTAIASFKKRHIYLYQSGDTLHQHQQQQHKTITEDNVAQAKNDIDKMSDEEYHAYRNREPTRRK
jgi:ribosome recycling factor